MFEGLDASISAMVHGRHLAAYGAVFVGGLLTAASPCVLAAIPLVIGYVGGYSGGNRKKAFVYSFAFVVGLSVTFTLLGVAASYMGRLAGGVGVWMYLALAVVAVAMGLSLMGLFELPALVRTDVRPKATGITGAFIMGLLVGVASSPCATPVLAVILAYAATEGQVVYGGTLLFTYALGHCMLILAAGVSIGFVNGFISSKGLVAASGYIRKASGAVIVTAGGYLAVTMIF